MWFKTSSINVEVTKKPVGNEIAIPEPELVKRTADMQPIERIEAVKDRKWMWKGKEVDVTIIAVDPETKNPVPVSELREVIEHRNSLNLKPDGTTVEKDDIHFFVLAPDGSIAKNEDGTDMEVAPFEPTSILDIPDENWVPSTILDGYLIRDIYELECKSKKGQQDLFSEAEKRQQLDQIGMITYSNGGFTQYYGFVQPYFVEGKFVWLLKTSEKKPVYKRLADIPSPTKVPFREVPTLQKLPPIQQLIVVASKKKK